MDNISANINVTGQIDELRERWMSTAPFHYIIIDDFFKTEFVEGLLAAYPTPDADIWNNTAYIHQRNKLSLQSGFPEPIDEFFKITESEEFRRLISTISGIEKLTHDPELIGGGLHQIMSGGYLDVHIDYNFHPKTKLHRRLNLLLYLNKDWKKEYEGFLELWDMDEKKQLAAIEPRFNRVVMFETNEVSYHGHPAPLKVPTGVTRKSLAVYYYTEEREGAELAPEHNTIYKQTTGVSGYLKTSASAVSALTERANSEGGKNIVKDLISKTYRKIKGLPPENK